MASCRPAPGGRRTGVGVLVVDRLLPGLDGLAVIEALRHAGVRTPALVPSALDGVDERVRGRTVEAVVALHGFHLRIGTARTDGGVPGCIVEVACPCTPASLSGRPSWEAEPC